MEQVLLGHIPQPRHRASPHLPWWAGPGTKPDQSGAREGKRMGRGGCLQGEACWLHPSQGGT